MLSAYLPSVLGLTAALAVGTMRFADASGQSLALDAPGVVYLVDFWAVGCKPCIAEMPDLERLAKEYEPSGRFRLVTVLYGGWKGDDLTKIAEKVGLKLPVYSDPESWHGRLRVEAYPTKFLIRDGKVISRVVGGGAGSYEAWKSAIESELKRAP